MEKFIFLLFGMLLAYLSYSPDQPRLHPADHVLLFGGCRGIGLQIGLQLARQFAVNLTILDTRTDLFDEVRETLTAAGSKEVKLINCDLSDLEVTGKVLDTLNDDYDAVIYNAGINNIGYYHLTPFQLDHKVINVNLLAPMLVAKHFSKRFVQQQKGNFMFIGSITSQGYGPGMASYISSKHALQGFIKSLRVQMKILSPDTRICTVLPWVVSTTLFNGFYTPLMQLIPALTSEEVAKKTVRSLERGDEEVVIPQVLWASYLNALLPRWVQDKVCLWLLRDNCDLMKTRQQ